MQAYYFLFFLGLIWTIFAVWQDIKKREVANWLTFSLVGLGLAYRAFYSSFGGDWMFLVYGFLGFGMFYVLAYAFYYGRVFAGGDAKLLMGYGVLLPYTSYLGVVMLGLGFVFLLFLIGAVWSLFYSIKIVSENLERFKKEFKINLKKFWLLIVVLILITAVLSLVWFDGANGFSLMILVFGLLVIYVGSLDKCMVKKVKVENLREGDWLEKDVRIGWKVIKKSVHGLSLEEIKFLKKGRGDVLIKEGIPFTPAFLVSLLVMAFVFFRMGNFSFFMF